MYGSPCLPKKNKSQNKKELPKRKFQSKSVTANQNGSLHFNEAITIIIIIIIVIVKTPLDEQYE